MPGRIPTTRESSAILRTPRSGSLLVLESVRPSSLMLPLFLPLISILPSAQTFAYTPTDAIPVSIEMTTLGTISGNTHDGFLWTASDNGVDVRGKMRSRDGWAEQWSIFRCEQAGGIE